MYARVARWEGAEGDALRRSADEISARAASGPPPGVPATGLLMLIDPDSGRSLAVSLFETEEDLRAGDRALNAMNPSGDDVGKRTSVESYEVAIDIRI
jgi:hypothetical protein